MTMDEEEYVIVKGTKYPVGLFHLDFAGLNIGKITEIKGLNKLEIRTLYLNEYEITRIEGLEQFEGLIRLFLKGNQLVKIEGLEKMYEADNCTRSSI